MRFILLDRITAWEPGKRGSGVKSVALSEDYFDDHFPLKPILPGVLLLESMAQLAGLVLEEGQRVAGRKSVKALMSVVEKAKFRKPAYPGDRLGLEAEVVSCNELGGKAAAHATRDGERIAECTLVFSFHEYEHPRLEERRAEVLALLLKDLPTDGRP
jgi:3-hydroxyacyl-[acyl-carrier-protein] dehydratase